MLTVHLLLDRRGGGGGDTWAAVRFLHLFPQSGGSLHGVAPDHLPGSRLSRPLSDRHPGQFSRPVVTALCGRGVNPKSLPTASQQSGAPLPLAARLNVIKKANTFLLLA